MPRRVEVERLRLPDGVLLTLPELGYEYGGDAYSHPLKYRPKLSLVGGPGLETVGEGFNRIYIPDSCENATLAIDYGDAGVVKLDLIELI